MFKFKTLMSALLAFTIISSLCSPVQATYNEQTSFLNPFALAKVYAEDSLAIKEINKNMDKLLAEGVEFAKKNDVKKENMRNLDNALGIPNGVIAPADLINSKETIVFIRNPK